MTGIVDYKTLKEQILIFLNRTDKVTVDQVPYFIDLAEKQVYRDIRVPTMEMVAHICIGNDIDSFVIPPNYLETRSMTVMKYNQVVHAIGYPTLVEKRKAYPDVPYYYARRGDGFAFDAVPLVDDGDVLYATLVYYRTFDDITEVQEPGVNNPNAFIEVVGDAFLYGALYVAEGFLDGTKADLYLQRYNGAVQSINQASSDLEQSGAPTQMSINNEVY